jgi:hypothetical protein
MTHWGTVFEELRRLVPVNRRLLAVRTKRRTRGLILPSRVVFTYPGRTDRSL